MVRQMQRRRHGICSRQPVGSSEAGNSRAAAAAFAEVCLRAAVCVRRTITAEDGRYQPVDIAHRR